MIINKLDKIKLSFDSNVGPKNVDFAFDLHGVILKPNIWQMIKLAIIELKLSSIFLLFSPVLWSYIFTDGSAPERLIDHVDRRFKKFGLTKSFLIKLLNMQNVNTELVEIIKLLRKLGYKVYLASNVWVEQLETIYKKFPAIKEIFDGHYNTSSKNYFSQKPEAEYYDQFKIYLAKHQQADKKIIFIDDKQENIDAANNAGFIGIKFKNDDDLIKKLKTFGFYFSKSL